MGNEPTFTITFASEYAPAKIPANDEIEKLARTRTIANAFFIELSPLKFGLLADAMRPVPPLEGFRHPLLAVGNGLVPAFVGQRAPGDFVLEFFLLARLQPSYPGGPGYTDKESTRRTIRRRRNHVRRHVIGHVGDEFGIEVGPLIRPCGCGEEGDRGQRERESCGPQQ